jgi:hypothetical protein
MRVEAYLDRNSDGVRGPDDPGAPKLLITVRSLDGGSWEVRTGGDGIVAFTALRPGLYEITVDPASLPPMSAVPQLDPVLLEGGRAVEISVGIKRRQIRFRVAGCDEDRPAPACDDD